MRLQSGNKHTMVLVEIDSNTILVEPMKSCKDKEMIQAYNALLLRLKKAGIIPKKHVQRQKKVSLTFKLTLELEAFWLTVTLLTFRFGKKL